MTTKARRASPLTARELEVMKYVAEGDTADDIALQLEISPSTVKTHITHIRQKLNVQSRAEAVALCLRKGYIR